MTDKLITVNHAAPDPDVVARVANVLQGGGIVAMRTDTVYGLLGSVNRPDALQRLVDLKVRPEGKPFILLAADWINVRAVTSHLPPVARRLGGRYWPGPLTMVLPAEESLPPEVVADGPSVAVRMPADPMVLAVLRETRAALAAPSANRPGEAPAANAAEVLEVFGDGIDLILDGGAAPQQLASTLIDCRGREGLVLREGPIDARTHELVMG